MNPHFVISRLNTFKTKTARSVGRRCALLLSIFQQIRSSAKERCSSLVLNDPVDNQICLRLDLRRISHKKAQKPQNTFVNFVPFCG